MLALTVREGDYVTIGEDIVVQVRSAIDAPRSMNIQRAKVHEAEAGVPVCIQKVRRQAPPKGPDFKRSAQTV